MTLTQVAQTARRAYVGLIAGSQNVAWWDAVVVTASSERQAARYQLEINRRREEGKLPQAGRYLVVPDIGGIRVGSGGATLHALTVLAREAGVTAQLEQWWESQRVLMIHSGGDSRRLPEYSLAGKLFSALPVKTPWGEVSTVFDETLAQSTGWVKQLANGLLVSSGDVVLTFDGQQLDWNQPGVCGAAMPQPVAVGSQHGVYVLGDNSRVYSFLQKPSAAQVKAAGGILKNGQVALDLGLLKFDPRVTAKLTEIGARCEAADTPTVLDLYEHVTWALTGEWAPAPDDPPLLHTVADALNGVRFRCSLVDGEFTHVGTTAHFQRLMTEDSRFTALYETHQRLGAIQPPGVRSAGTIVDSALAAGSEINSGAIVIECDLRHPVRCGKDAILHGLMDLSSTAEIPESTVVHQVPVLLDDGRRGVVFRVYGVGDDPKVIANREGNTWMGRPMAGLLSDLGMPPREVWGDVPAEQRSLWNARLFALANVEEAWKCALWMMGFSSDYSADQWRKADRLSLEDSAKLADSEALATARGRRMQNNWKLSAVALAETGTDMRPLLARAPGIAILADAGRTLRELAANTEAQSLTEASSRYYQASQFLAQAGLDEEVESARTSAFDCIRRAVDRGGRTDGLDFADGNWQHDQVTVRAPARIDLGGGWSDTPPFCLDWGGTVLNIALTLNGEYPIATSIRRIDKNVIRCVSGESGEADEYRTSQEALAAPKPGSALAIPRAALQLAGIAHEDRPLEDCLHSLGGGIEIRTEVNLPMGSGLGTSSILAATLLKALAVMAGADLTDYTLSDQVMRLEQLLTTGGGWQDQAGGIFPGAKLLLTGPGGRQKLRVEPVSWSDEKQAEFCGRFVLYYTGIRRVAKNLLAQVVGSYLGREVGTVQVLHSIKTLAVEMSYAMREGDWSYLGQLLNRHWQLNQVLDPHTTNAPIDAILAKARPYLAGAKLAGAGGGGFLLLLAKTPEDAERMRNELGAGLLFEYAIANDGFQVEIR